jgi:hypothetical protein
MLAERYATKPFSGLADVGSKNLLPFEAYCAKSVG